jgi:galactokinase/mevalonate kinase-like predicted kinase
LYGGQVTNVAVDLNGQPPIQVFCRPTSEPHLRLHSIDLGMTETLTDFAAIEAYADPTAPFALPRAAMALLGFTRSRCAAPTLTECLRRAGSGIEITIVCAAPKGSGLGTSSILAATLLAALHRFFGIAASQDELFRQTLEIERMLTTGGGWQDQIGGIVGGVKYIECTPGLWPHPVIHQLDPYLFEDREAHACWTLFYTGVTRLAKNILQEVVEQCHLNTPAYVFTMNHIRSLAVAARDAISRRDRERLFSVLNESWAANTRIHASATNEAVDDLLAATRDLHDGVKLLGAGGGGYALFASETPRKADALRERLANRFENDNARIVSFSLNRTGLQVTTS